MQTSRLSAYKAHRGAVSQGLARPAAVKANVSSFVQRPSMMPAFGLHSGASRSHAVITCSAGVAHPNEVRTSDNKITIG